MVLAAWQLCASQGVVDQKLTSSPWGVVQAARFLIDSGQLGSEVASSAKLFGVGLGLAIVIGALGGVLIGWWRLVAAVFEPWIAILYAMPLIALLPLILVWFGIGFTAEVVMVVLISVFPVLVSVMTGTRNVDQELVRLARSFCGSELAIIRTVLLPSLVPYFVSGVRLAIGSALVGVVVSEYFLGNGGIGGLIVTAGENLQSGEVFVGITILALSAIVMTGLLRRAERHFSQWRDR
jgi:NitT/TauT family transport system permease protein